jgi:hypothetical protein
VSREFELPQRLITPEDVFLHRRDFLVGNAELSVELAPAAESLAAAYDNSNEFGLAALYHS